MKFQEFCKTEFSVKFMFSKKATKIDEILTVDLTLCSNMIVISMVKISLFFVAFLENMNFKHGIIWCDNHDCLETNGWDMCSPLEWPSMAPCPAGLLD